MNTITLLGMVAGALTTVSLIPQVIKTVKSKSAGDMSLFMYLLFAAGISLWLLYGLLIQSLPIIVANTVTFVFAVTLLVLKLKYPE